MTEWIISSSVLIAVISALRFILRGKISLRLQYALWALVLVRLLVPVSFGVSPVSVMNALPDALPETAVSVGVPANAYAPSEGAAPESSIPATPESADAEENIQDGVSDINTRVIDWGFLALVVWLAGFAAVGLFLLIANLRFSVRLKSDRRMTGISEYPLPVYLSGMVETPCMFGLFHPAIYVTQEAQEDEKILRHVLEHEATHYRHGDHIWAMLRCVCLALHWYSPLVWLAASLSMRDAELACDEGTIKRIGEEWRCDYGRSIVGLTCRKHTAGTLLSTATTMTGSKKSIKERIVLIAKKPKTALYTLVAVILVAAVAVCGTFTSAKGAALPAAEADSSSTAPSVSQSMTGADAYTIPLSDIEPYQASEVEVTTADSSDIASVIVSYVCDRGTEVMFYRAQNGDIYGAYMMDDDTVVQFAQGYWADNNWGYQDGYDIKPYKNVFGHDGFYVVYPAGAAFIANDYYYFEPDGTLKLMIHCCNNVLAQDLDGDGATELLWFYHGGELAYYCFEQNGVIYEADLNALLTAEFPDWSIGFDQDSVNDGTLGMIYGLSGEDSTATYYGEIKFTEDSLMVYEQPSEVWLLQREDYEVGLRNQGDQTEILLRRDGAVTVLGSVPSNSGSDMRYSLRSFDAIPELSGFVLENLTSYGWGYCSYYAVRDNSAVCFAQSFGVDMTDIAEDLDGDGHAELICNVTYNADGVNDVFVYRMKDGIPQVADVKDAMLNIPEDKHLACLASAAYDSNTGSVTLEYRIEGEDDWRVETAPIDYNSLQFENFTATW
ncbi:MAG: M56 family metallopeptidase [Oscillospiraceae bacterium]|nr:M56 family metallopeptidase [Oscillospiraceae bacterium]